MRVSDEGQNLSESIAHKLYDQYFQEAINRNETPEEFTVNYAYVLDNGLVFRLFDGGEGPGNMVLEFAADPDSERKKEEILGQIPEFLRDYGIENERALAQLVTTIETGIGTDQMKR